MCCVVLFVFVCGPVCTLVGLIVKCVLSVVAIVAGIFVPSIFQSYYNTFKHFPPFYFFSFSPLFLICLTGGVAVHICSRRATHPSAHHGHPCLRGEYTTVAVFFELICFLFAVCICVLV